MPRSHASDFFRGYRFGVIIPGMEKPLGIVHVISETHPVHGEVVRIATGHEASRRPLAVHLVERREVEVWCPLPDTSRRFGIHYDKAVWHPLDLDARKSEIALETILLVNPRVTINDFTVESCPEWVQTWMRPAAPKAVWSDEHGKDVAAFHRT